jgi:gas vesicle structural protein
MTTTSVIRRPPASGGLYDVLELILDKGLVIDAYVRVSLIGIELITIDLRIVVASVDTYLRFAAAVDRLNLEENSRGLPEFLGDVTSGVAKNKTSGAIEGAKDSIGDSMRGMGERMRHPMGGGDDEDDKEARAQERDSEE